jgi:aspartate kinase
MQNYNAKKAIVVSAMRDDNFNTTSKLEEIWKKLFENTTESRMDAINLFESISEFHIKLFKWKIEDRIVWSIQNILNNYKKFIVDYAKYNWEKIIPTIDNDYTIWFQWNKLSLLWLWEELSAKFNSIIINSISKNKLNTEVANLSWVNQNWIDFYQLSENVWISVKSILEKWNISILPWFIPWYPWWILTNVWRWYSDATASILAVWLKENYPETQIHIQKLVDWFMSWDPRIVNNPKLIENLNYMIAQEIIWSRGSQAKLLHTQSLRQEIQEQDIPVHVYNPFWSEKWTVISKISENMEKWILYVWWIKDISSITMSSWKMEQWFIAKSSSIISQYTDIWIDFSSATEQSYTIPFNIDKHTKSSISSQLINQFDLNNEDWWEFVKYNRDNSVIFCVWNMKNQVWILNQITSILSENNINIKAISQWLEQRSISFIVWKQDYEKAVKLLHHWLIEQK